MPTRLLIGLLWFWLLAQLGCNLVQGLNMTNDMPQSLGADNMSSYSITTSVDTSGVTAKYIDTGSEFFSIIGKIFWFDYPAIYENADGTRDELRSYFQYFLIVIGIVMWVSMALYIKSVF